MAMTREQHLLGIVAEECAEVAQRAIKAVRFGLDEVQPGQDQDNKERLERELGQLLGVCDMLGIVANEDERLVKPDTVEHYAKLSIERGLLEDPNPEPIRIPCPKGCGLYYLPEQALDHSCWDS